MDKINNFINWAKNNHWNVVVENNSMKNLPENVLARYNIPDEYKTFLENIKTCTNSEENVWFLCIDDYSEKPEGSFRWNEFEIISLEAADGDAELINAIENYWNKHLPILFNVKGEYEYYAINTENKNIVYGYEPEFEESETVADNFGELLDKIMNNENRRKQWIY
jgi:mRNA degradation ribonuclease J1/J2